MSDHLFIDEEVPQDNESVTFLDENASLASNPSSQPTESVQKTSSKSVTAALTEQSPPKHGTFSSTVDRLLPCLSEPKRNCDQQPASHDWHRKTGRDIRHLGLADTHIPRCVHWGACQVRQWLRNLGLAHYEHALVEQNAINGRRLCLLASTANLTRMGIHDWSHIRQISEAVRTLLDIDDVDRYSDSGWGHLPGPMTRALYLLHRRPTGGAPICSEDYADFLLQHGFMDAFANVSNERIIPEMH